MTSKRLTDVIGHGQTVAFLLNENVRGFLFTIERPLNLKGRFTADTDLSGP